MLVANLLGNGEFDKDCTSEWKQAGLLRSFEGLTSKNLGVSRNNPPYARDKVDFTRISMIPTANEGLFPSLLDTDPRSVAPLEPSSEASPSLLFFQRPCAPFLSFKKHTFPTVHWRCLCLGCDGFCAGCFSVAFFSVTCLFVLSIRAKILR